MVAIVESMRILVKRIFATDFCCLVVHRLHERRYRIASR